MEKHILVPQAECEGCVFPPNVGRCPRMSNNRLACVSSGNGLAAWVPSTPENIVKAVRWRLTDETS